ncbi:RNase H domain-containing protein [Trichonephila clavipes]|nr:RNase H domain-containing protein [Trichonephila clavipes]
MQRPVCYQDLKTSAQNYVHRVWQDTLDQQVLNKLHSIHPSTSHWAALPVRRHDVRLTRLRIGHTRFTHRHLLLGIIGNEQADSAAKSATTHLPLAVPLSDMKRVIMHHIFKIWQESWSPQLDNKLHSVKPVIGAWPVMPLRRTDVKLTRLRIGHTLASHTGICCLENVLLNVLHAMSLTLFITF